MQEFTLGHKGDTMDLINEELLSLANKIDFSLGHNQVDYKTKDGLTINGWKHMIKEAVGLLDEENKESK